MSTSLLRIEVVKARTGLSRSEIYRRIGASTFPAPITISGSRIRVWPSDFIDSWVEEQILAAQRGANLNKQEA